MRRFASLLPWEKLNSIIEYKTSQTQVFFGYLSNSKFLEFALPSDKPFFRAMSHMRHFCSPDKTGSKNTIIAQSLYNGSGIKLSNLHWFAQMATNF